MRSKVKGQWAGTNRAGIKVLIQNGKGPGSSGGGPGGGGALTL